jgi:hypothetical protein
MMGRSETMVKLTLDDDNLLLSDSPSYSKISFTCLTGDVLDIIAEYLPQNEA